MRGVSSWLCIHIVKVVVLVVVKRFVEVEVQLFFWLGWLVVGGWSEKTKVISISTQIKVVVEVEVELGNSFKWEVKLKNY